MVFAKENHETGFARVASEREAGFVLTGEGKQSRSHACITHFSFSFCSCSR